MKTPTKERQEELIAMVPENYYFHGWFDYHEWDGLIECDEKLTDDELSWMRDNLEVKLVVTRKA